MQKKKIELKYGKKKYRICEGNLKGIYTNTYIKKNENTK